MSTEILHVVATGMGMTFQDHGRPGWKRFGVPAGGPMDRHAAEAANCLLGNPPDATVLELLWQGAKLRVIQHCRLAITGSGRWEAISAKSGQFLEFPAGPAGLWTYIAIPGGFVAPAFLNSMSTYSRARLGPLIAAGQTLRGNPRASAQIGSSSPPRDYAAPPAIRVWRGPQWDLFPEADRRQFFAQDWTVSPQSDRVGYRLTGTPLTAVGQQILSEPVCAGTIQVPESGLPIITMRDGPTVGGYPKLGLVDPADLDWVAQCRPGTRIRFHEYRPEL